MIALDTNVLVRFLVRDDDAQAERARCVLEHATQAGEACFISDVVVCELVWVLRRSYKLPQDDVVAVVRRLLAARDLTFSDREQLGRALARYAARRGDLADYVIREHAEAAGAASVVTFDEALLSEDGFLAP